MSNVVQFLEALSIDPSNLSEQKYAEAISKADFDPLIRKALLQRDVEAITSALGGRTTVMAFILPAEQEPDQQDEEKQDDDGDQEGPEHVQEDNSLAA